MLSKAERATKLIAEKLAEIKLLIQTCEEIAIEAKVDFVLSSPYGSDLSFDGTGKYYSDDGQPTGWDHSQC